MLALALALVLALVLTLVLVLVWSRRTAILHYKVGTYVYAP